MSSNPGRLVRRGRLRLLLLALPGALAAEPPPLPLPAGGCTLAAQTMMPHLDRMRLVVRHHERCFDGGDALPSLFPVMRQPALTGCNLGLGARDGERLRYVLIRASSRVATGSAEILPTAWGAIGKLDIRMGGKYMTFAQRVEASRRGDCEVAAQGG
jgi:hypothetical protein